MTEHKTEYELHRGESVETLPLDVINKLDLTGEYEIIEKTITIESRVYCRSGK